MSNRETQPRLRRVSTSVSVEPTSAGELRFEVKSTQDHVDSILAMLRVATHAEPRAA